MKHRIILANLIMLAVACPVMADLLFDSGHNTFDDSDPYYDEVWVINDAVLDVLGGAMGKLEVEDYATVNIYEGDMESMFTKDSAVVSIYSSTFDMFAGGNDSLLYLYAYDVTYHFTGGLVNDGWIEGTYYSNDIPFSFSFYTDTSYSHINIVPEPTTISLLALGGLVLRRRKKQ